MSYWFFIITDTN